MKAKLAFVAGLGVGYVVGTRVGRRGYENLKSSARSLWETDKVQETVTHVEETLKEEANALGSRLVGKVTGSDTTTKDDTGSAPTAKATAAAGTESQPHGVHHAPDVESDPALNDDVGQDWTDEGGALPSGPAQ
ncbi:hypothetical protein [Arthrobacter dokdonensis]|jgi:hypothetical protein|uniref:hypothetical protein n=1 Tax=Arthrobacter dokdonellae TaxID=2211210 RepID=UPI000DE57F66|nr:hypothetical protein [Arthrobacter dokdonellae]